ncbi:MAG TPA: ABC transporter substrate-binding protein [Solirubrobacterales bacterium]|nr:ABC transporter substrate-binding protein [Solirubrobacterales bacterium]
MTGPSDAHRSRIRAAAALVAVAAIALAACGGDGSGSADDGSGNRRADATLVLDFVPGPVHAGIYDAVANGYYEDAGIDLEIIEPTSTADTLKLIDAGKADFGLADGIDVAGQIAAGRGAKGIMAIVQRPLGGLITLHRSGFDSPADLEGRTVGITGVPSDDAVLDTMVADAGGDPATVKTVTIGFNGVQDLEAGKIDAFTGYVPSDGVQVEVDGYPATSFGLDAYGGPRYPGLVAFSTVDKISSEPDLMQAFVSATVKGYEHVLADPQAGLDALLGENPAIPERFAKASLDAYLPLFEAGADRYGRFDAADLRSLSRFLIANHLIDEPIGPGRYATNEFVDGSG